MCLLTVLFGADGKDSCTVVKAVLGILDIFATVAEARMEHPAQSDYAFNCKVSVKGIISKLTSTAALKKEKKLR